MNLPQSQTAGSVLMVRPAAFGANPLTAESNVFQAGDATSVDAAVRKRVDAEFDAAATALERSGVEVCMVDDTPVPAKPDAIFPNNWVSFHADGTAVLYPMLARNRRTERRLDILESLTRTFGFRIARTLDLTVHEGDEVYLEGTGSLVLDRVNRHAFACFSSRTHLDALGDFAQQLDYEIFGFSASDTGGTPIYHTNVLMCVGTHFAVICADTIEDPERRNSVCQILERTGHEVIEISREQLHAFVGNMLELRSARGPVIAMSATALAALTHVHRTQLEKFGTLVSAPIPTIERYGGGSVRCMLAEIHLPKRA
jgi:hypothetical protein